MESRLQFEPPLIEARLLRRYRRFLADVAFSDGTVGTVHCPNTGSMLGCAEPGSGIWLSRAANPRRKYAFTWELVEVGDGTLVGVNTARTNRLVAEALAAGELRPLDRFVPVQAEVVVPERRTRVDFVLGTGSSRYFLEVKNVTAAVSGRRALFPDAVSERATRHVRELTRLRSLGHGAGLLFCVQRADVDEVAPADAIDPVYGEAVRAAAAAGVDLWAWRWLPSPHGIALDGRIRVAL